MASLVVERRQRRRWLVRREAVAQHAALDAPEVLRPRDDFLARVAAFLKLIASSRSRFSICATKCRDVAGVDVRQAIGDVARATMPAVDSAAGLRSRGRGGRPRDGRAATPSRTTTRVRRAHWKTVRLAASARAKCSRRRRPARRGARSAAASMVDFRAKHVTPEMRDQRVGERRAQQRIDRVGARLSAERSTAITRPCAVLQAASSVVPPSLAHVLRELALQERCSASAPRPSSPIGAAGVAADIVQFAGLQYAVGYQCCVNYLYFNVVKQTSGRLPTAPHTHHNTSLSSRPGRRQPGPRRPRSGTPRALTSSVPARSAAVAVSNRRATATGNKPGAASISRRRARTAHGGRRNGSRRQRYDE